MEMMIPFDGFYDSNPSAELDYALEMALSDSNGHPNVNLIDRATGAINWPRVHTAYARDYAAFFVNYFKVEGATFAALDSPREYNFGTDRIFVDVPAEMVSRMAIEVNGDVLTRIAAELFTSRSGFASHYSPNVNEWGGVDEWDHNQLYALLLAWIETPADYSAPMADFTEDWYHGDLSEALDDMLFGNRGDADNVPEPELLRIARIASYLREREERQFRSGFTFEPATLDVQV